MSEPRSTTFLEYLTLIVRRACKNFSLARDMLIGAFIAIVALLLQVVWRLIGAEDWHAHKWPWMLSVVLPFIFVLIVHIFYRLIIGPWKLYQDQDTKHAELECDLTRKLGEANARIEALSWPANRPQIVFERWGQIPNTHPEAKLIEGQTGNSFLQCGFYLANDGDAAHEVTVEGFQVGPAVPVGSKTIARIEAKGKGFALIWLGGYPLFPDSAKWDLLEAMAKVSRAKYSSSIYSPDFKISVFVTYRDANNLWYRSRAGMTYVRS